MSDISTRGTPSWCAVLLALTLVGNASLIPTGGLAQDEAPIEDVGDDDSAADRIDDEVAPAGEATDEEAAPEALEEAAPEALEEAAPEALEEAAPEALEEAAAIEPDPDTGDADAEEPAAHHGPALTFSNSFFTWTHGVTVNSFSEAAQLSYDPTYQMSFALSPRFYLTDTTFLWLNQSMALELTDSNSTTYNREPVLADTLLDLRQTVAWEGFVFQLAGRLGFPVSKSSQAANRILQTGLGLSVVRPFPEAKSFALIGTFGYRRWWATTNVPTTADPYPAFCPEVGDVARGLCRQASGQSTARDILLAGLILSVMPLPGFTVSASGFYFTTYGHELAPAAVAVAGGALTIPDQSVTHWRPFTYISLAVAYDVLPWLNLQLGVQNSGAVATLYSPDGSLRSPFSVDTQVYLTTTIGIDAIVNQFSSGEDELTPEERLRRRQGM